MIRKLLMVAAAIAMPVSAGAVALVGTASVAGAVGPTVNCAVASTVTFAPPGLSKSGAVTTATTSATKTATTVLSKGTTASCSGSIAPLTITSKNTKCTGKGLPSSNPACVSGKYGYGSWANYASGGTSSILTSLPTLAFKVGTVTYTTKNTKAAPDLSCKASATVGSEIGFTITGAITKQSSGSTYIGAKTTFNACLGLVTGTGLLKQSGKSQPGFLANFNKTGNLVKTAVIDKLSSSLTF